MRLGEPSLGESAPWARCSAARQGAAPEPGGGSVAEARVRSLGGLPHAGVRVLAAPLLVAAFALFLGACAADDGGPSETSAPSSASAIPSQDHAGSGEQKLIPAEPSATPSPEPTAAIPPLTLERIFQQPNTGPDLNNEHMRTLLATGDVIPGRSVNMQIIAHGNDFFYPFEATAQLLDDADVTVMNLEAPLIEGCPPTREGIVFCGQPGFAGAMAAASVDVVTLENNHIGNYGSEGISATRQVLQANGMECVDRYTSVVREVRGVRFAFLAFNGVGESFDRESIASRVREADAQADVVVVAFHWGAEYVSIPQSAPGIAPDEPVEIAHLAVDAGADLVLGNHPHWVQALELYGGKLIVYAHGNFILDQMWSYETTIGVLGRYTFYGSELVDVDLIPTRIVDYAQPVPLEGEEAAAVLSGMYQASVTLAQSLAAGR